MNLWHFSPLCKFSLSDFTILNKTVETNIRIRTETRTILPVITYYVSKEQILLSRQWLWKWLLIEMCKLFLLDNLTEAVTMQPHTENTTCENYPISPPLLFGLVFCIISCLNLTTSVKGNLENIFGLSLFIENGPSMFPFTHRTKKLSVVRKSWRSSVIFFSNIVLAA